MIYCTMEGLTDTKGKFRMICSCICWSVIMAVEDEEVISMIDDEVEEASESLKV